MFLNQPPPPTLTRDVLLRDGTAVDAAIATLLCDGLFNAHSMGVGGGFFMTVYLKESGETAHLNARETAPHYATEDMYEDDPSQSSTGTGEWKCRGGSREKPAPPTVAVFAC